MNQKNSLGLNKSFKDEDNPISLFKIWFEEAKKSELNDPNALSLATSDKNGNPSVRMVLLKSFDNMYFLLLKLSLFAFVTNFSIKGLNSFAFSVVVVIVSCLMRLIDKFLSKASL